MAEFPTLIDGTLVEHADSAFRMGWSSRPTCGAVILAVVVNVIRLIR